MKKLLALIENELREVNTTVTCPICGKVQSFKLDDLGKVRLGTKNGYTGTGGMPMVQCEHCKAEGKTTLIQLNERFYKEMQYAIYNAIEKLPIKYIDARWKETEICVSK